MNSIGGWGEFGNYISDPEATHEWYQKLGLFLEFFRTEDKSSLSVLSNIEFIADPDNDINFNPRAIFWEEAFLYTHRISENFWQAGYYHRCKHDIDNLDYQTERSLIYGSIMGRYIFSILKEEKFNGYLSIRGDVYTILQDYRKPESHSLPDTEDLAASLMFNASIKKTYTKLLGLTLSGFVQLNMYSGSNGFFNRLLETDYVKPAAGIETGVEFTGTARIKLNLRYEYFSDTGLNIVPQKGKLLSIGVSLFPSELW